MHAGSSSALYLHDPDGLGIEVYADRPRQHVAAEEGELRMATLPLDVAGLVAAGGGSNGPECRRAPPWVTCTSTSEISRVHRTSTTPRSGSTRSVWSYTGALFMAAGGYHHHLGLNTWAGRDAIPAPENEARLLAWQLVLPDEASSGEARRSLDSSGIATRDAESGWFSGDPWGTTLHVVAEAQPTYARVSPIPGREEGRTC